MGVRLYGEHANVHQSHSQNDSGDLRGVAGRDGELGCLCGKAPVFCVMAPPIHLGVVNGYGCLLSYYKFVNNNKQVVSNTAVLVLPDRTY